MPPPKRKCRLRWSSSSKWSRNSSLSDGHRRRISTGDDLASSTLVLADWSSALHPSAIIVHRNINFKPSIHPSIRPQPQQGFAKGLAFGDRLEGLRKVLERVSRVDVHAEDPGFGPVHELAHVL